RPQMRPDDVVLPFQASGELRVLLAPDDRQVHADERSERRRHENDVREEEAPDDGVRGKLAPEHQERDPRADDGDRQRNRIRDAQSRPREQVVRHRIAGEPVEDAEQQQRDADDPIDLARTPEGPREVDPAQVHDDRRDEHERGPVVDLAHDQSRANAERQVDDRLVGAGHRHAVQRQIRPVVRDLRRRRIEEQPEEDARRDEYDEAVQRDLAEHERPVIGKDLLQRVLGELGRAQPVVEPFVETANHVRSRFQKPGPTGSEKSPAATMNPLPSIAIGSCGSGRVAGPDVGRAPSITSNTDWWHGQNSCLDGAWYRPTGHPACVQSFENATNPWGDQSARCGGARYRPSGRWMSTAGESPSSVWPSGNTVRIESTATSDARTNVPSSRTARTPGFHAVLNSERPGAEPSERIGNTAAPPSASTARPRSRARK